MKDGFRHPVSGTVPSKDGILHANNGTSIALLYIVYSIILVVYSVVPVLYRYLARYRYYSSTVQYCTYRTGTVYSLQVPVRYSTAAVIPP